MGHENPGRCPGLCYFAPLGLLVPSRLEHAAGQVRPVDAAAHACWPQRAVKTAGAGTGARQSKNGRCGVRALRAVESALVFAF